jgi:hypothetical protein
LTTAPSSNDSRRLGIDGVFCNVPAHAIAVFDCVPATEPPDLLSRR